jgi:GH24 family phage-related lysozyme (muramidase)
MPPTRKTSLEKKLANATVTPDEIYKYLTIDKGLSHEHAMGMLPNIVEESEFIYNRIQSDTKYDPDHSKGRQGIGLFQYTEPTRRKNFVEAVPDWQTNWKGQIDFALSEPETKKYLNQSFDTLEDASRYFTTDWERPKNRFKQAEKRLEYVPDLLTQIEAQNTKPYASETFQSYVMPTVNVIEQDPIKEYIDLNSDNTINDLALAGQQMNYFAQGGARNANNMKRYYATGGVRPELAKAILGNEGFVGEVYSDLGGTPTIGYGFTKDALTGKDGIPSWKEYWNADGTSTGKTMSKEEADRLLEKIIKPYSDQVNNSLSSEIINTLSQEQYDSLVDLTYRNGIGNMKDSGVFKAINDGNLSEASKIIVDSPDLNKIGGKQVNPGDAGYNGIKARNLRASAPFSNLDSGVDPTVDNMAAELGMPTSGVYNNLLAERGEFQRRSDIEQLKELDSEKVYDQTIDDIEGMLNNLFMNDNYQVRGEDVPSTFNTGVKERMDWLSQKVPNIERVIQPYGGEGERFKVDRKAIKDDIYTILDELGQITDESSPLSYKSRIYKDPYQYQQPDSDIPGSDFIDPRYFDRYRIPEQNSGISESDVVDPELPIRDSYAGPAISVEDADRLYNEDLSNMESGVFERENQNTPLTPEEIERLKSMMSGERTPSTQAEIDYKKEFDNYKTPKNAVDRNFLSKLKGQDYMGLLSDIGGYAARMAPLSRAMREASSYDEERYPRFSPILPTATLPKRDVRDAFATAQQTALQQGKLDLGALSALATQQAKETARVEENVANERVGLLNQAQQINNQITMQEMADTAANKGAAATMKYQALAAMSEMGQGSLREANMRRNDQIVKQMFSNVFGDEFA